MRKRNYADYARPRTRLVNFLADNIIFNLSTFVVVYTIGLALMLADLEQQYVGFYIFIMGIGGKVAFLLAYLAYYTLSESIWGRSPAKFLTKTRVVELGGGDADWMVLVGRSLCRLIPFEPVSFLVGANWHDKLSNTCVVYDN